MTEIDPFKNFTPRQNPHKSTPACPSLTEADMAALDGMDATALKKLIQRVSGAMWGIGLKSDKQLAEAMKMRLAHIALTADVKDALVAIERWLDRTEGKPLQAVDMRGNLNVVNVNASIEFVQSARDKVIEVAVDNIHVIDNKQ